MPLAALGRTPVKNETSKQSAWSINHAAAFLMKDMDFTQS